ncbi:DUF1885 family protein [Brevibacillus sp. SYSU BS000544]|uniref:DUF1885 family protein n=1 Tax=Brevibacillus sp. SYSU BS000544 TaxID=3416443 RepID=UPI003CE50F75
MNLQTAYIYLVEGSVVPTITLAELKAKFQNYMEQTKKTGAQLGWEYASSAFPYMIEEKPEGKDSWFVLKGKDPKNYRAIIVGVGKKEVEGKDLSYIQITLPEVYTTGDRGKANEFTRYLGREYKGEAHLFNGRVQYFQPRKV